MADKKISELDESTLYALTGFTVVVDNDTTYKSTLNTFRQLVVDSGSHYFTGSQTIGGDLTVSGSLIAQQYILSSSVTNMTIESISGSTAFGNSLDDTHIFTGALFLTGSERINGKIDVTGSLIVSGTLELSGSVAVSASNLAIYGSGSANPLFSVNGSLGQIFSVYDELTNSLWSINDASGLPVFEAFADSRIFMGNYQSPMLLTSVKTTLTAVNDNIVYQNIPTSGYSLVYYDYLISSASNLRSGELTAIWDGSSVNLLDTTKINVGTTSGVTFSVTGSSGNLVLSASANTNGWITKIMIKAI